MDHQSHLEVVQKAKGTRLADRKKNIPHALLPPRGTLALMGNQDRRLEVHVKAHQGMKGLCQNRVHDDAHGPHGEKVVHPGKRVEEKYTRDCSPSVVGAYCPRVEGVRREAHTRKHLLVEGQLAAHTSRLLGRMTLGHH